MMLRHWYPINELRHWEQTMDRLGRGFGAPALKDEAEESWAVPVDVVTEGENVVVHASLPGVDPKDIQVTLEEGVLTIRGETTAAEERKEGGYLMRERRTGSFYRALRMPDSVDTAKAEPTYENGVLSITFPKAEAKKAKRLEIKVGKGPKVIEGKKS
jgi:HSP20 family protein